MKAKKNIVQSKVPPAYLQYKCKGFTINAAPPERIILQADLFQSDFIHEGWLVLFADREKKKSIRTPYKRVSYLIFLYIFGFHVNQCEYIFWMHTWSVWSVFMYVSMQKITKYTSSMKERKAFCRITNNMIPWVIAWIADAKKIIHSKASSALCEWRERSPTNKLILVAKMNGNKTKIG